MKRFLAVMLAVCLAVCFAGCDKTEAPAQTAPTTQPVTEPALQGARVAMSLPEETAQWQACAEGITTLLAGQGHSVQVQYAQGSTQTQIKQIHGFLEKNVDLLLVASVDDMALDGELENAAAAGVQVVTLDRQVIHAQNVDAAVTFDYVSLGVAMGSQIIEAKTLDTAAAEKRSYTIEFFMGTAEDHNAVQLHQGLLSVLQPYLDSGVLRCETGRVTMEDTYIQGADRETAKDKCTQYLEMYTDKKLDIVCAAWDSVAAGCIEALTEAGYTEETWPVITGVGGDAAAVRNILEGKQTHTIYRDSSQLQDICSKIAHALLTGEALSGLDIPAITGTSGTPVYHAPVVQVSGVKGLKALLDYGVSAESLGLSEEDMTRINAPEEETPAQTEENTAAAS